MRPILLLLFCIALSGCGTFSDHVSGPITPYRYYRGVRFDCMAIQEGGLMVLMAADLPLSAVADTIEAAFIYYDEMKSQAAYEAQQVPTSNTGEHRERASGP